MKYYLGIIAGPRHPFLNLYYCSPQNSEIKFNIFSRPWSQSLFFGHSAIYLREDLNIFTCKGLVPVPLELLSAVISNKNSTAHWEDDQFLFTDPASITFEVQIDSILSEKFLKYFESVRNELTKFQLKTNDHSTFNEGFYNTNCVHAAILVFINFLMENQNSFGSDKKRECEHFIQQICQTLKSTRLGHLLQTLQILNAQKFNSGELRAYLRRTIVYFVRYFQKNQNSYAFMKELESFLYNLEMPNVNLTYFMKQLDQCIYKFFKCNFTPESRHVKKHWEIFKSFQNLNYLI